MTRRDRLRRFASPSTVRELLRVLHQRALAHTLTGAEIARLRGADVGAGVVLPAGSRARSGVRIGNNSEFSGPVWIEGAGPATLGSWVAAGHGLRVFTSNHDVSTLNMHVPLQRSLGLPVTYVDDEGVTVGNAVWIGDGVTILPGATIGDGAVVGAGSVVTGPIEPFGIAVGNPARVVRMRCSPEVAARLLEIEWWNWPREKMIENRAFFSLDIGRVTMSQLDAALNT